jgi:hypothetical protein
VHGAIAIAVNDFFVVATVVVVASAVASGAAAAGTVCSAVVEPMATSAPESRMLTSNNAAPLGRV